jgi:hypothetical protein
VIVIESSAMVEALVGDPANPNLREATRLGIEVRVP